MQNLNIDLFKIMIVILAGGFLFLFYQYSQNGRYQNYKETNRYILDTRTGKIYKIDNGVPSIFSKAIKE